MNKNLPLIFVLLVPAAARGAYLVPAFYVAEVYDDNLFVSPDGSPAGREDSFIHRFGPRLELGHRAAPFTLIGRYELDINYVDALPEEGTHVQRHLGVVELIYRPTSALTLGGNASYLDTQTPVELATITGLDQGRARARRLSLSPSAAYQFNTQWAGRLVYLFSRDTLVGLRVDSHVGDASVGYRLTRRDTPNAAVIVRQFVFNGEAVAPSEVLLLGWVHQYALRSTVSLRTGPRFRSGEVDGVEADATIRHAFHPLEFVAGYTRTETTIVGVAQSLDTDAVSASVAWRFMQRSLLRAGGTVARVRGGGTGLDADVRRVDVEASAPIQPWLSLAASYAYTWQRVEVPTAPMPGNGPVAVASGETFHHVAMLALVMTPPKPIEL